jgi:hypothetical protein
VPSPVNSAQSAFRDYADTHPAGATVIRRIRRVLIFSVVAAFIYPLFMGSSRCYCSYVLTQGAAEATRCVDFALKPSPFLYAGVALLVLIGIGRVADAVDQRAALRTLDRTMIGVGVLVVGAIVISQLWFRLMPVEDFVAGSGSIFSPFPFGLIDVAVSRPPEP